MNDSFLSKAVVVNTKITASLGIFYETTGVATSDPLWPPQNLRNKFSFSVRAKVPFNFEAHPLNVANTYIEWGAWGNEKAPLETAAPGSVLKIISEK